METPLSGQAEVTIQRSTLSFETSSYYSSAWEQFVALTLDLNHVVSDRAITQYVDYLHRSGLGYKSIGAKLLDLSVELKVDTPVEFVTSFIEKHQIEYGKRLILSTPFSEGQVKILVAVVAEIFSDHYLHILYATVFSWAFYACLRLSEYTEGCIVNNNLHRSDIEKIKVDGEDAYKIKFRAFSFQSGRKLHDKNIPDFILRKTHHPRSCPVMLMDMYLRVRPMKAGPLFMDMSGKLEQHVVSSILSTCIDHLNWKPGIFNTLSFRTGRAVMSAGHDNSFGAIQHTGRWFSKEFLNYAMAGRM